MSWDLRGKYNFDASEGQIPEGNVSVYGPANSHANCVPASFTAVLSLLGLGDIDPQQVTNEIYGPNYRGGFGNFTRMLAWIKANVPAAPAFSDGPFDFNVADSAGAAGLLIVVAGWIDAASVTFKAPPASFSHASLLVAHDTNTEKFVIWNTWTGQLQTYDRAVLAASLYEMAVMAPGLHQSGAGNLSAPPTTGGKMITFRPLGPAGRFDVVWLFQGEVWHAWGNNFADLWAAKAPAGSEQISPLKAAAGVNVAEILGAAWTPDSQYLCILVVGDNAKLYGLQKDLSGTSSGWRGVGASGAPTLDASLPSSAAVGTPGPKGDKGDPGKDGSPGKDGATPTSGTITGGTVRFQ